MKILKKVAMILLAISLVFTSTTALQPTAEAATVKNCKNPYPPALSKYNPCKLHTKKSFISIQTFAAGAGTHYVGGAGLTHALINKGLKKAGQRTLPGATITLAIDGIVWSRNQIYLSSKKRNIKGWNVTHTWRYKTDPLADGGGIPKKHIVKVKYVPVYK